MEANVKRDLVDIITDIKLVVDCLKDDYRKRTQLADDVKEMEERIRSRELNLSKYKAELYTFVQKGDS